jgi:hypothetical protein
MNTLVEFKVPKQMVKFTVTRDRELRIKIPVECSQEKAIEYVLIGYYIREKLKDIDRTYRGKIKIGETEFFMWNDSKTDFFKIILSSPI